jgi:hypothetical protein
MRAQVAGEHVAFGFEGLTWDQVEAYWRDIARAASFSAKL